MGTVVSRPGARHPVFCPGTYYPPFPVLGLASDGALMLKIWIMGKTWWKRSSQVAVCSNGISRPKKTPKWLLHDQTVWKTMFYSLFMNTMCSWLFPMCFWRRVVYFELFFWLSVPRRNPWYAIAFHHAPCPCLCCCPWIWFSNAIFFGVWDWNGWMFQSSQPFFLNMFVKSSL